MPWLRIDDGYAEHRKLLQLKRTDRWTWTEILCWCARQADNGHVPAALGEILRHATPTFLHNCATIGLLDPTETGDYTVHDWHIYNPKDPTNAARQQRYRNAKRNGEITETVTDKNVTHVTPRATRVPVPTRPLTPSPAPVRQPQHVNENGAGAGADLEPLGDIIAQLVPKEAQQ